MSHVIQEKCLGEQYAACVDVCPVECIHPIPHKDQPFMVIDPDVCIDCGVCLPECPIGAIVGSVEEDQEYAKINKELTPASIAHEKEHGKVTPRPPNEAPRKPTNKLVK